MSVRGYASSASSVMVSAQAVNVNPVHIQQGDLVLLMPNQGQASTNTLNTYTYPIGFAPIPSLPNMNQNGDSTMGIAYKWATPSEPSIYQVNSGTVDFFSLECWVLSGRNPVGTFNAVNATPTNYAGNSPVSYNINPVTSLAGDDVLIYIGNKYYDGVNTPFYAPPPGFTTFYNFVYGNVFGSPVPSVCVSTGVGAGPSGTAGGTYSAGSRTDLGFAAMILSIPAAPPAAGAGTIFHRQNRPWMQ